MVHEDEESTRIQYPLNPNAYKILAEIGVGVSAVVYKALCLPMDSAVVAIKAINLDQSRSDFDNVRREAKFMSLLSHPNILKAHCSFTVDRSLWVVMPFMSAGSLQSIISSSFPDGLTEPCIAIILKETLNALSYLHNQGHLHRDIKAGNILMDSNGTVKLADFGVSASIFESGRLTDVAGTPYWMAPEVIHSHRGYSFQADIWSFGITALELAHGRPPLSHLPPSKSLIMKITKRFRFSDYEQSKTDKKFSKSFKDMVASCLDQDPIKRPSAEKLLKHSFFKNCKGSDYMVKNVLQGLPSVEERFEETKPRNADEEEWESEEGNSQGHFIKQRRVSGWNFNEHCFELDPVFPIEKTTDYDDKKPEMVEPIEGIETVEAPIGIDRQMVARSLWFLERSLYDQRQEVLSMLSRVMNGEEGGEQVMNREEQMMQMVERLKKELESERDKNFRLEMEMEFFKLQVPAAATAAAAAGPNCSGSGDGECDN